MLCEMETFGGGFLSSQIFSFLRFQMHQRVIANVFWKSIGKVSRRRNMRSLVDSALCMWQLTLFQRPTISHTLFTLSRLKKKHVTRSLGCSHGMHTSQGKELPFVEDVFMQRGSQKECVKENTLLQVGFVISKVHSNFL